MGDIKTYWVQVPPLRRGFLSLLFLALGFPLTWFGASALIGLGIDAVRSVLGLGRYLTYAELGLIVLGGAIGPVVLIAAREWYLIHRRMNHPPVRGRRLQLLLQDADRAQRFPHRQVERLVRRHPTSRRRLLRLAKILPPGTLVVVNGPRLYGAVPRPCGAVVPFEPIDIHSDDERLGWLLIQDFKAQDFDIEWIEEQEETPRPSLRTRLEWSRQVVFAWAAMLFWVGWLVYSVYRIATRPFDGVSAFFLLVLALASWAIVAPLFWERRWWVIPAGLMLRDARAWRGQQNVWLFAASSCVLLVDLGSSRAVVSNGRRSFGFASEPQVLGAAISAWLTRARQPSMAELLSFAGPGAVAASD